MAHSCASCVILFPCAALFGVIHVSRLLFKYATPWWMVLGLDSGWSVMKVQELTSSFTDRTNPSPWRSWVMALRRDVEGLTPNTLLSRVVWLRFLGSSLQREPDPPRPVELLCWTFLSGGRQLSPLHVRTLDFLSPLFPSQAGFKGNFYREGGKTSKFTTKKHGLW